MHERRARISTRQRQLTDTECIDRKSPGYIALGPIDGIVGPAVEDDRRLGCLHNSPQRCRIRQVRLLARTSDRTGQQAAKRGAELAGAAEDQRGHDRSNKKAHGGSPWAGEGACSYLALTLRSSLFSPDLIVVLVPGLPP